MEARNHARGNDPRDGRRRHGSPAGKAGIDLTTIQLPFRSIVVTGGDGFVGRLLVSALMPRLSPDATMWKFGQGDGDALAQVERVEVDLRDPQQVDAAVREAAPDLVLHLAAQSSVAHGSDPEGTAETWSVNLGGSLNLARSCTAAGFAGTFLFISSAEVYGRTYLDGPVDEGSALAPQSAYGRSKAAAEAMLADVLPEASQLIIARPCNHSGPGQDDRFVLPSFATQIAAIERGAHDPVLSVGNLEAERDFLDVRDVIDAYLAILDAAERLGNRVTLNIASGTTVRIATLLDRMLDSSKVAIRIEQNPDRLRTSDIPSAEINTAAIRAATNWQPTHSIDKMLSDILDDARARTR